MTSILTFDGLIDTSADSGLVFRPLSPVLETPVCLIWNRHETFTPAAARFLAQVRSAFDRKTVLPATDTASPAG